MRILYLVHQFFPEFASGTERVTLNLAQAMQRAGHHVQVLGCVLKPGVAAAARSGPIEGAEQAVVAGVPTTMLPRTRLPERADTSFDFDEAQVAAIGQWMQAEQFDLVHMMHSMRMGSAIAAAARLGLPTLMTLTDFFPACVRVNLIDAGGAPCAGPEQGRACARKCFGAAWGDGQLEQRFQHARSMLERADACVVPSPFVARRFRDAFAGIDFTVIAHGIDLAPLARGPAAAAPEPGAPLRLSFIGSLIPAKGVHLLLQALALRPDLALRLKIAGGFYDDPAYEARVRALAAADARVQMLGHCTVEQVAALLGQSDLLCLPSLVPETYSLALHEAAAVGVPSLVSGRGAPAEAIRDSGAGAVVSQDSAQAWAEALAAWTGDAQARQAMRLAVRPPPRVEEEAFFYESLYRRATAGPR